MRVSRDIHNQRLADFLQTADEATLSAAMEAVDGWGDADLEAKVIEAFLAPRIAAAERGDGKWIAEEQFWAAVEQDMDQIDAEFAQKPRTA